MKHFYLFLVFSVIALAGNYSGIYTGYAKAKCEVSNSDLRDRAREDAYRRASEYLKYPHLSQWTEEKVETFGFPECQYKHATSTGKFWWPW